MVFVKRSWLKRGGGGNVRSGVCVAQDVAVLEILGVGTHLQVLFEGFLPFDWGEGRLVHEGGVGVWVGHGFWWMVELCVFDWGGWGGGRCLISGRGMEEENLRLFVIDIEVGRERCLSWRLRGN